MVGLSKLKNLPHCSNLKVRHKAPKTTKYVPLRHSQHKETQQNRVSESIQVKKCKQVDSTCEKMTIFADGLLGNPRHFERKKRYAHSCSLKM